MENKGAKFALVIFMIFTIVAFAFGTILAVPMLTSGEASTAQEAAGQAITIILLVAPFLLSYMLFALFDIISFFISVHLIRNDSKGIGVFNLLLCIVMMIAAVVICAIFFKSH